MNFIDRALSRRDALTDDGFLQAMADIYKEPQVWEELTQYPLYIGDVGYLIDYDTELQMEGLDAVVTGGRYERTLQALVNCGASGEAEVLRRAKELSDRDPDYEDEEAMDALSRQLAIHQDYAGCWDRVRTYIGKERRSHRQGRGDPWRTTADTVNG